MFPDAPSLFAFGQGGFRDECPDGTLQRKPSYTVGPIFRGLFWPSTVFILRKMLYTLLIGRKEAKGMLQLLMGRSGSGKTYTVIEELADLAREGRDRPLLLLVPEQFSFESERALLNRLGPEPAGRIQVLSFTRLAQTVFREIGGVAGKRMDDGTRALLMSQALEACADQLSLYQRHIADPEYISAALAMLTELKQCAVTPEMLEETSKVLEDGTLKKRLGSSP